MDDEHVEFRAGRDTYGLARWVVGSVLEREQRADGAWFSVLPANSESDAAAQWVRHDDVRPARADARDTRPGA